MELRLDDELFVTRCLEGDQAAFTCLMSKYKEMVHAYAYHKVGDYQVAEDITQEVFVKAYSKLGQLKWPHRFQSWLYSIVSNECKMWLRKHAKEREKEVSWGDVSARERSELADRTHDDEEVKLEMELTVRRAMETLPADSQLTLSLYYMSDLSIKEIAYFMGISPNNVKVKLHRARERLGERLEKMLGRKLRKEKLRSGFIYTMVDTIRNMPLPSIPKRPRFRWTTLPMSIGLAMLIGIIGFGLSSGRDISTHIPVLKPIETPMQVCLLPSLDDQGILYMEDAREVGLLALESVNPEQADESLEKEIPMLQHDELPGGILGEAEEAFHEVWNSNVIQRSDMANHLACMRVAGFETDYETLMSVSGWGLSFAYEAREDGISFSVPGDPGQEIARATGFGWERVRFGTAEEAWMIIKESLEAGKPVRGNYLEDLMFVGYQDAPRKGDRKVYWLCNPFAGEGKWWTWSEFEKWVENWLVSRGNNLGRHTGIVEAASPRETATRVMKRLVAWNEHNPLSERFPKAKFGVAGMEAYADDLADVSKTMSRDSSAYQEDCYFDRGWGCYAIYPQWTARKCTAVYLTRAAEEFAGDVRDHVLAAAREYDQAFAAWEEWESHLGREHPSLDFDERWASKEHRQAGAAAVRKAIMHEKAAIAELEEALAQAKMNVAN